MKWNNQGRQHINNIYIYGQKGRSLVAKYIYTADLSSAGLRVEIYRQVEQLKERPKPYSIVTIAYTHQTV